MSALPFAEVASGLQSRLLLLHPTGTRTLDRRAPPDRSAGQVRREWPDELRQGPAEVYGTEVFRFVSLRIESPFSQLGCQYRKGRTRIEGRRRITPGLDPLFKAFRLGLGTF